MVARFVRSKWVVLALGVLMLGVALMPRTGVTCGGSVMRPDDTCEHGSGSGGTAFDYSAQRADRARDNAALGWAGGAVTLGAIGWIVWTMRRRTPDEGLTVVSPIA